VTDDMCAHNTPDLQSPSVLACMATADASSRRRHQSSSSIGQLDDSHLIGQLYGHVIGQPGFSCVGCLRVAVEFICSRVLCTYYCCC